MKGVESMKKILIHAGILTVVFIVAVIVISIITNIGNVNMTADMGAPTRPVISFQVNGYRINALAAYREEMDIPSMRGTITPLTIDGRVKINIDRYGNQIESLEYAVYPLDGSEVLGGNNISDPGDAVELNVNNFLPQDAEGVLKVTLNMEEERKAIFYTRIIRDNGLHLNERMSFVNDFHRMTFDQYQAEEIREYLEPGSVQDNNGLQRVTTHSSLEDVTWGNLTPEIVGDVAWNIKETNPSYIAILLEYQVASRGEENERELYNVREFFRVRYFYGTVLLLTYDRTMNEIFDGRLNVLTSEGINLGISDPDVEYKTNEDGTVVSFVRERELWNYHKEKDQLSLVFSFVSPETRDIRNLYGQHEIKVIEVGENGSTTFAVHGYMNRGMHEGRVGIAIYYFDIEISSVEEKAFIPSNKSHHVTRERLGSLVYYNHSDGQLYIMVEGRLYQKDIRGRQKEILIEDLEEGQYISSEDGKLLAYQSGGGFKDSSEVTILNFQTGEKQIVEVGASETVIPLGFVQSDFIYGVARQADLGQTITGETVLPMYKMQIRDSENDVIKTYQGEHIYILGAFVEGNLITIYRATRHGERYIATQNDFITNHERREENNITLSSTTTERGGQQMYLAYRDGIQDTNPRLLRPRQVILENPLIVEIHPLERSNQFYVYGLGEMLGIYARASDAIQRADQVSGVVVSANQAYVWERGNRPLRHQLDHIESFVVGARDQTLAACLRQILLLENSHVDVEAEMAAGKSPLMILDEHSGGEAVDLTGCTVEQIFYFVGRGTPVIAIRNDYTAVLIVGYDMGMVTFINPLTGLRETVPLGVMESMIEGSGNTFIGYVR